MQSISWDICLEGQRVAGSGKRRFRSQGPGEPFKYSERVRMSENKRCELCRGKIVNSRALRQECSCRRCAGGVPGGEEGRG